MQICVVNELERCEESTPANLVDAMFKFIRNETPCVHIAVCIMIIIIHMHFHRISYTDHHTHIIVSPVQQPPSRQTSQRSGAESLSVLSTLGVTTAVATIAAVLGGAKFNVV